MRYFQKVGGGFDWMRAVVIVGCLYGAVMLYIALAPTMAAHDMFQRASSNMARINAPK